MASINMTYKDYVEYRAAEHIWICISPCLLFIGTVANILSITVLVRKSMRTSTTMFYLTILSFGDLFVLYTGLFRFWLQHAFKLDLRLLSDFGCKVHAFLVYFSLDFTTWILVAVTVDRCVSVALPLKAKRYCSLKKAKVSVVIIGTIMALINIHLFNTVGIVDHLGELQCQGKNDFIFAVWPWIDFCVFSFIPFSVMIISNIIIIRQIVLSKRRLKAHNDKETMARIRTLSERSQPVDNNKSHDRKQKVSTVSSITVMLLTVNCVFLVLTVPIVIWLIGYRFWYVPTTTSEHFRAVLQLLWAIANMLQYTNNTIHFFLYCLTGPRFRSELKAVFKRKNKIATFECTASAAMF